MLPARLLLCYDITRVTSIYILHIAPLSASSYIKLYYNKNPRASSGILLCSHFSFKVHKQSIVINKVLQCISGSCRLVQKMAMSTFISFLLLLFLLILLLFLKNTCDLFEASWCLTLAGFYGQLWKLLAFSNMGGRPLLLPWVISHGKMDVPGLHTGTFEC